MRPSRSQRRRVSTLTPRAVAAVPMRTVGLSGMPRKSLGTRSAARAAAVAAAAAAAAVAACGGNDEAAERPTVYAASSLRAALPELLPAARYSFAGSNQLRRQVEQGARADV